MVYIKSYKDASSIAPWWVPNFFVFVLGHSAAYPAMTPISATYHQLSTLCRSICADERAQTFNPIVVNEYCILSSTYMLFSVLVVYLLFTDFSLPLSFCSPNNFFLVLILLLTGSEDVSSRLERVEQVPSNVFPRALATTDRSGDETDVSEPPAESAVQADLQDEEGVGARGVGRFFVTGPTDVA